MFYLQIISDKMNIHKIREDFPILSRTVYGKPLVYLDNGATTQKPRLVIDSIVDEYYSVNANVHRGVHFLSQQATELHEASRETVRQFINARSTREVIFTRGTTESINLIVSSFGEEFMQEGDEVIVSVMEHHSNIVPWQLLAARKGIAIKVIPMNDKGELLLEEYENLFSERTKIVSVTQVSNVLGTINPVKEMIATAHAHGVPVMIDGAQSIPHMKVDVQDLDADFFVFSGHKIYGPTGIGVLYGKEDWLERLPPYQGGGEMIQSVSFEKTVFGELPFKFEAGTPDYIATTGLAKALDYVTGIGLDPIALHEHELTVYAMQRLKEAAEKAKIELSSSTSTEINLPYIMPVGGVPKHLVKMLTRAKFESLAHNLIQACLEPCKKAMQDAGLSNSDIDEVILVGGSSRIPAVQKLVEDFFGKTPSKGVNPDEVVAVGAAVQGAVLTDEIKGVVLLDVTPLSMGIETLGGVMTKLIDANTTIPARKSETFSTAADNQTEVTIHVLQGERPMAAQNKSIGQFNLTGIAPARRGVPQIEVTFDIDANGILKVSAKDKATGKEQAIRIEASSGLSKEEIEKMKAEAEANAEADKKEREKIDKLNQADSLIFQTETQLKELGDKLPADKKAPIEAALQKLKDAHKAQDMTTIDSAMAELNTAFQAASAEMYAQSGAQGGAQAGPDMNAGQSNAGQNNGKQDDNVQDADFEEVK